MENQSDDKNKNGEVQKPKIKLTKEQLDEVLKLRYEGLKI